MTKSDWISVEDRLPGKSYYDKEVLVYGERTDFPGSYDYDVGKFYGGGFDGRLIDYDEGFLISVTHWQPLPEPPEGK